MIKSNGSDFHKKADPKESEGNDFKNPLAVIRAAVDLLSKDPNNRDKISMVCKIISEQALVLSEGVAERLDELEELRELEEDMAL